MVRASLTAFLALLLIGGCASSSGSKSVTTQSGAVIEAPKAAKVQEFTGVVEDIHPAAYEAATTFGFKITYNEWNAIAGDRTRSIGLAVGSGGESINIIIQPTSPTTTAVTVWTNFTFVGRAGQRDWSDQILEYISQKLTN